MSNVDQQDIDDLLTNWSHAKEQIADLENRIEKYKRLATRILTRTNTDLLQGGTYTLKKRIQARHTLGQKDVPKEVWSRYAKRSEFPVFYLSKK